MAERRDGGPLRLHRHPHGAGRGGCLYETVLSEAIAGQHGLADAANLELLACAGCGKAYLLGSVWLPFAEQGEIACPRCGELAVDWDGPRGHVAYWQRERELAREHHRGAATRPPLERFGTR